jgi:hypothetical protein
MSESPDPSNQLDKISKEVKNFYSAGSSFSTIGCASAVALIWSALAEGTNIFNSQLFGLILSFLIVISYALVLPEPSNYPHAGKLRLTVAEILFGVLNSLIVYAIALGFRSL